jgi:signal transduction histidine kinase
VTLAVSDLARDALAARRAAIADLRLEVRKRLDEAWVQGSETLLTRMVANVVDNAVRHNEPGGWLLVTTEVDDALVTFVVESGGPVIDEDNVRELAQPFRRLGGERTGSENGVGLGLSIVSAIARAYGGTLGLRARPEGGLCVTIELPRAPRPDHAAGVV